MESQRGALRCVPTGYCGSTGRRIRQDDSLCARRRTSPSFLLLIRFRKPRRPFRGRTIMDFPGRVAARGGCSSTSARNGRLIRTITDEVVGTNTRVLVVSRAELEIRHAITDDALKGFAEYDISPDDVRWDTALAMDKPKCFNATF
ncbi:unnamed protein product [Clonostachys chloroleuca]|uniref:Uncharacterized protein n=1 Tax=Clonostachys chloroleuca TaxID=1926264 RepID=A0AA35LU09_9HYPO|nr:unnamed protein product [Clonostachys chloroleuca]